MTRSEEGTQILAKARNKKFQKCFLPRRGTKFASGKRKKEGLLSLRPCGLARAAQSALRAFAEANSFRRFPTGSSLRSGGEGKQFAKAACCTGADRGEG